MTASLSNWPALVEDTSWAPPTLNSPDKVPSLPPGVRRKAHAETLPRYTQVRVLHGIWAVLPPKTVLLYMGVCCSCKKPKVKPVFTPAIPAIDPPTYGCASERRSERETVKTEIPLRDVCFIKMANTISNIKMSNPIKNLVSKRRRRYIQDGYNLDLTCILLQCIVCTPTWFNDAKLWR